MVVSSMPSRTPAPAKVPLSRMAAMMRRSSQSMIADYHIRQPPAKTQLLVSPFRRDGRLIAMVSAANPSNLAGFPAEFGVPPARYWRNDVNRPASADDYQMPPVSPGIEYCRWS